MGITRITDQALRTGDIGYVYNTGRWGDKPLVEGVPARVVSVARKYATVELEGNANAYNGTFKVDRAEGFATGRDYRRFLTATEAVREDRFHAAVRVMRQYGLGQADIGGRVELTLEQVEGIVAALQA
jgi:hypothetical protein